MIVANVVPRPPRTEMVKQKRSHEWRGLRGAGTEVVYSEYISVTWEYGQTEGLTVDSGLRLAGLETTPPRGSPVTSLTAVRDTS